jgi:hypothetical protein
MAVHADSLLAIARSAPPHNHTDSGFREDREPVAHCFTQRQAATSFHLVASANGGRLAIAYRPTLLIEAI